MLSDVSDSIAIPKIQYNFKKIKDLPQNINGFAGEENQITLQVGIFLHSAFSLTKLQKDFTSVYPIARKRRRCYDRVS